MRSRRPTLAGLAGLAGFALAIAPATARADETSTTLAETGKALADAGDYTGALARFRQALDLEDTPQLRCNVGAAYYKLRDWMRAHAFLVDCLSVSHEPGYQAGLVAARDFSAKKLELGGGHAKVEIEVTPAGATVTSPLFDESFAVPRTLWLPLGENVLTAALPGHVSKRQSITLETGSTRTIAITLEKTNPEKDSDLEPIKAPAETGGATTPADLQPPGPARTAETSRTPARPSRAPAIIIFSGAGALLAGGAVFHLRASRTRGDLTDLPAGDERRRLIDDLKRDRAIMIGLYGTAAVAAGIGAWLWLRNGGERGEAESRDLGVSVAPDGVAVFGRF